MMYTLLGNMKKKCPECNSKLVNLYVREGAAGKRWIKVKSKYCKKCKEIVR